MEYSNHDEWRIEEFLESRSFDELSPEEKVFVLKELGSEQEYNTLRKIGAALVADKADLSPDPRILNSVRQQMQGDHAKAHWLKRLIGHQVPAYYLVATGMVFIVFAFIMQGQPGEAKITPVRITSTDTVYVSLPADTVFVERTVVKYVQPVNESASEYSLVKNDAPKNTEAEGVSMTEKEELERFLVSGS